MARPTSWVNYTNTDSIWKMLLEGDSTLWLASQGGLVRWNIRDGTHQVIASAQGLIRSHVRSIAIDPSGNKWIGTFSQGAMRFDGSRWMYFTPENTGGGLLDGAVDAMAVDRRGRKWFGTSTGASLFNDATWTHYLEGREIDAVTVGRGDSVWCGQFLFDGSRWTDFRPHVRGLIRDVFIPRDGTKWFASLFEGAYHFDGTTWTNYTPSNSGIPTKTVYDIEEDSSGAVWFATGSGLARFDGEDWQVYTTSNGLPSNWTTSVVIDADQNKWIGTMLDGLVRFDGVNWTRFLPNQIADNDVQRMVIDKEGNKWFATWRGLSRFDSRSWTTFTTADGLPSKRITDVALDSTGQVWVATRGGVAYFDGANWTSYTNENSPLPTTAINCVAVDPRGNKWFGTMDQGATRLSIDGVWQTFNSSNSDFRSAADVVFDIAFDDSENVWFATWGGASRFYGTHWANYDSTNSGLRSIWTLRIFNDRHGNVWFCTLDRGVTRFDGTNWTTIDTTNSGLGSNGVFAMDLDAEGNYWFAAYPGVTRFDGLASTRYTSADGLASNSVTDIAMDAHGNKWFCSNIGQHPVVDWLSGLPYGWGEGGVTVLDDNGVGSAAPPHPEPSPSLMLYQNQPNPFNGQTTIVYDLPARAFVSLKVYNLRGQELETLIAGPQEPGRHRLTFGGDKLPTGVYICELRTGKEKRYRKMCLLR